jgi:hypothetical protein
MNGELISKNALDNLYDSITSGKPPTHISFFDKNGEWKTIKIGDFTAEEIKEMLPPKEI